MKKVGVLMGKRDSDLPVVRKALDTLASFGVPYEVHVYSAHRLPLRLRHFVPVPRTGGSVYSFAPPAWPPTWPAPAAANTTLPVIGIPMASAA